jgi:hypothetical protein
MNKNKQYIFQGKNLCVNQKVRSLNLITALPIPPQGKPDDTTTISVLVSKEMNTCAACCGTSAGMTKTRNQAINKTINVVWKFLKLIKACSMMPV